MSLTNIVDEKPKRPLSAYNIFFQKERERILSELPDKRDGVRRSKSHGKISFASLAKRVAAKWNCIDPIERSECEKLAAENKLRYKQEMEEWRQRVSKSSSEDLTPTSCMMSKSNRGNNLNYPAGDRSPHSIFSMCGTAKPPTIISSVNTGSFLSTSSISKISQVNNQAYISDLANKLDEDCMEVFLSIFVQN